MLEEPILDLDDIQGNVLPGFKKDSQHFLFFQIVDPQPARLWLKSLAPRLWTAREVLAAHSMWKAMRLKLGHEPDNLDFLFLNCAISAQGLAKLGVPGIEEFDDKAFKLGLEERSASIGDPPRGSDEPGAPETWMFGAGSCRPDVLLILATDDLDWAVRTEEELITSAQQQGLQLIHVDRGRVRPGTMAGHEHFGFKDGISHPAIRGRRSTAPDDFIESRTLPEDSAFDDIYRSRFAAPGRPLVWPGHFLFGYLRQKRDQPESSLPNSQPLGPAWAVNGSFLVYRRLSQDVQGFRTFLVEASETLRQNGFDPDLTPERLGALLVGRWASGWPIMRDPNVDRGEQQLGENYFTFTKATTVSLPNDPHPLNLPDPNGLICPFAAHIRKVNPRDDDVRDLGNMERTFQKLLLRRGITFGQEIGDKPQDERGLLFVAFQTSIVNQFEFLMKDWVNNGNKPQAKGGVDPIISAARNTTIPLVNGTNKFDLPIPGGWVVATGGEYMFTPGIRFFSNVL